MNIYFFFTFQNCRNNETKQRYFERKKQTLFISLFLDHCCCRCICAVSASENEPFPSRQKVLRLVPGKLFFFFFFKTSRFKVMMMRRRERAVEKSRAFLGHSIPVSVFSFSTQKRTSRLSESQSNMPPLHLKSAASSRALFFFFSRS